MAGCGAAAAPPCCLCMASALTACSKSVPKCRKSGTESKERMSLRSKQTVKRGNKKGGWGKSQNLSAGVPGCCSPGSRGVSPNKEKWRVRKGDNWIVQEWEEIPYSLSLSLEDSALGQEQAVWGSVPGRDVPAAVHSACMLGCRKGCQGLWLCPYAHTVRHPFQMNLQVLEWTSSHPRLGPGSKLSVWILSTITFLPHPSPLNTLWRLD